MFEKFLTGIGAGVSFALLGLGKSKGEGFDWSKFTTTLIIGAVAGGISEFIQLPIPVAVDYLINMGLVVFIENGLKTLWRRLFSTE